MKTTTTMICTVSLGLLAALHGASANASDRKFYSVGGCAPYTTGTPNYNLLRIRPESVQNQSTGYLYVICPIVRDSEGSWGTAGDGAGASVDVSFRTNTAGSFQCTLNIGSNDSTVQTLTKLVSGDPGDSLSLFWDSTETGATTPSNAPVSMVCRLPPKGSIVSYSVIEYGVTNVPPAP